MKRVMIGAAKPHVVKKADTTPALPPSGISWSSPSPDSLVLSWTPGTDPDSILQRHEYRINGGAPVTADGPDGTTVTGLVRRTTYTVEVRAVSGGGPSAWVGVQATTLYAVTLPGFSPAIDDNEADMRPQSGVTWTAWVALDGSGDYTSVAAAAKAANDADANRTMTTRALIFVKKGTYVSPLVELHNWTGIIGATGNPADVVIENVTSYAVMENGGRGAVDTWGATYCEAITCKRVDTDAPKGTQSNPKYAVHGTSGKCSIWANCVFDVGTSTNAFGVPSVFGQDGGDGNYTLFYKSTFIGCRADSDTNVHAGGGDGDPAHPEQVAYVDCHWQDGGAMDDPATTPTLMGAFGFKPLNDARKNDALWIVGCTGIKFAQMIGGAGGIVHKPADLPMTSNSNPGTIDTRQDWPIPKDWGLVSA